MLITFLFFFSSCLGYKFRSYSLFEKFKHALKKVEKIKIYLQGVISKNSQSTVEMNHIKDIIAGVGPLFIKRLDLLHFLTNF